MAEPFDHIAEDYDNTFTESETGKRQRKLVHNYLKSLIVRKGMRVLELNCGTGADAIFLAQNGCKVVATDSAAEMVRVTKNKSISIGLENEIETLVCDFTDLSPLMGKGTFDLVLSNFGGLNCASQSQLIKFNHQLTELLNPGGRFVAVVMSKFCWWETFYFLVKFKFRKAFRRWSFKPVNAHLGNGHTIPTWYYSMGQFQQLFPSFEKVQRKPVGLFLPPSYLENAFVKRPKLLNRLERLEHKFTKFGWLAGTADHFLMDLQKKG